MGPGGVWGAGPGWGADISGGGGKIRRPHFNRGAGLPPTPQRGACMIVIPYSTAVLRNLLLAHTHSGQMVDIKPFNYPI
jgi:hypothetical protein